MDGGGGVGGPLYFSPTNGEYHYYPGSRPGIKFQRVCNPALFLGGRTNKGIMSHVAATTTSMDGSKEESIAPSNEFTSNFWYPIFKKYTFETVELYITEEFRDYLCKDGIITGGFLPRSSLSDSEEEQEQEQEQEQEEVRNLNSPKSLFPLFHHSLEQTIKRLGGKCLVKVGDSTAKDAIWITTEHSLCCYTCEDVYELLKASDRVALALATTNYPSLTIRKWYPNIDTSMEFRCFVWNKRLIAICQRDDTVYFEHLKSIKSQVLFRITKFIQQVITPSIEWTNYVVDLYLEANGRCKTWIVDFGPWDELRTSGILFNWEELKLLATINNKSSLSLDDESTITTTVKFIEAEADCRLGHLRYNCLPADFPTQP